MKQNEIIKEKLKSVKTMRAKYSIEYNLVSHQVRRKRAIFLDTLQCLLGISQILLSLKEYQEFAQPVFWENKDYFQSTSTCDALRTINLAINFVILAILVCHHLLMYRNALYEGQDYLYDKKSNYFFFSSKHFIQLLLEIIVFAIIIPPKFLN